MKSQILSLLLLFTVSLCNAQTLEQLDVIWKSVLAKEKAGLMMHSEDYDLLRNIKNRTTTPKEIPYPQMTILVDSMKMRVDVIQEYRRVLAQKRDRIIKLSKGKDNFKKSKEAVALFDEVETEFASSANKFDGLNKSIEQFHQQFGNLKMLYRIDIVTYDEYFKAFLVELEELEDQMVKNASIVGKTRQELEKAADKNDNPELIQKLGAKLGDLTEIQKLSENKIVQIQNFQDRLGATVGENEIYSGPGIEPPYEIGIMRSEMAKLNEHFKIFKIFNEEQ